MPLRRQDGLLRNGALPCIAVREAILCILLTAPLASTLACDQPPAAESLKEWTPVDHHSNDDGRLGQPSGAQVSSATRGGGDVAQLVDVAWRQQCSSCHGASGRGDGQMGPMVQAPDMTQTDWQSKVTDAEMASTIKNGKNRMPKFDLPDPVVGGLVARVRSLRER
jgi:hypothetical protein